MADFGRQVYSGLSDLVCDTVWFIRLCGLFPSFLEVAISQSDWLANMSHLSDMDGECCFMHNLALQRRHSLRFTIAYTGMWEYGTCIVSCQQDCEVGRQN